MLPFDLASLVRHVLVVLVTLGVLELTEQQLGTLAAAVTGIVSIALAVWHSRRDRSRLLHTPPPPPAPKE